MLRRTAFLLFRVLLVLLLVPLVLVPVYAVVPPVSTLMLWRWVTGEPVKRAWRPLDAISPNLVRAVIISEDARFCAHRGVDWGELRDAIEEAAEDFSEARGASTIAMQTAKNLFLWPGRQFVRKALEVPLAYYMVLVWPKRRLAEVYLNVVEWGPDGEFGAEVAAQRAFGKSARVLTAAEAALLAATLPNPHVRNAARPGPALRRLAARREIRAAAAGSDRLVCLRQAGR
jgi:monofunctional biosynthetic peptidoglycan transglycosylase